MTTHACPDSVKTLQLPNGTTYSYVCIKATSNKPCLLFLHGFPESSYDWHHQISHFRNQGYGIIAPDLLGYGNSSKPADPAAYRLKKMCEEVLAIVDAERVDKVIGVGHDWGSMLLSRMSAHFPERFIGYAFVSIGYTAPQGRFDAEALNKMTEQMLGYPAFGYFLFFDEPGAVELLERNADSTESLLFGDKPGHWAKHVCPPGAAREWLTAGTVGEFPAWLDATTEQTRREILAKGGYTGPTNWYRQSLTTVNDADENGLPEERRGIADQPVLLVADTGTESAVPGAFQKKTTADSCRDLRIREVESGHWMMLEAPGPLNRELEAFFASIGG